MTEPTTRKVNAHTNLGTLQQGDVVLGERTSGTTGLFTVPDLSAGGAVDSVNGETGVVVLTSDDISTTAQTNKFVTAADITNLSNLSGVNTGDQTSIVGITGTKAEFDAAISDGNFLYSGDVTQYTDEMAQDAVGGMVDTSLTYVDGTPLLQRAALTGDVTASAGSNATTIANDAVTYAKMQNVSATDKLLGRSSVGSGDVEEIACTAAGRAILDDATAGDQRTTLGLVIGTDVQAYDAELAALAGLTSAADKFPYFTGSGTAALADLSSATRTFLTTPSSANLASLLTDETGSGANVHATSPTLVTPVLGVAEATSINFGQDALNYYDEGTYTPTFTFATPGNLSVSYAFQGGFYTRIGNLTYVITTLVCTPTFTTASGQVRLEGLPFTSASANHSLVAVQKTANVTFPASTTQFFGYTASTTYLTLRAYGSTTAQIDLTTSNFTSGQSHTIVVAGIYTI